MNESNLEGSDPLKKSTMETIDCPLRITFYKIWRKRMKDNIPEFLQTEFNNKQPKYSKFPKEIIQFILDYSNFYQWNISDIKLIFKMMKKGFSERLLCTYKNCNNPVQISTDHKRFSKGCCAHHSTKIVLLEKYGVESPMALPTVREKVNNSIMEKYGVENISQLSEIKKKKKETTLKNYGVENPLHSKEIKEKVKNTNIKKYGGVSPACCPTVVEKMKSTTKEKYGVENVSELREFREKAENTMEEKYGVRNISHLREFREKAENTMIEKYGVKHAMHHTPFIEKCMNTNIERFGVPYAMQDPMVAEKSLENSFQTKEFKWKTGEVSLVQGYEPIVLKELEDKGYTYEEVITGPSRVPTFPYVFEGEEHLYFPDIFIPKENLVIEVKSDYTLNINYEKNQAKFSAVKSHGFDFKLEVR